MKLTKIFSLAAVAITFSTAALAQTKTESFNVSGNCSMCKSKIEKAAKEAGAKSATWDVDSKQITVTYKTSNTNTAKIQEKIATAGYDNAGVKAPDDSYNKLHGCCKYDRTATSMSAADHHEGMANCCKKDGATMDCCKDGKCSMAGHDGKDCCKKDGAKMDCCKDGKCSMPGHDGKDCCKKSE